MRFGHFISNVVAAVTLILLLGGQSVPSIATHVGTVVRNEIGRRGGHSADGPPRFFSHAASSTLLPRDGFSGRELHLLRRSPELGFLRKLPWVTPAGPRPNPNVPTEKSAWLAEARSFTPIHMPQSSATSSKAQLRFNVYVLTGVSGTESLV